MKKVLAILLVCFLSSNLLEAQWYTRSCGVADLSGINTEAYECLSKKVSKILWTGKATCIVGTSLALAGGITMLVSDPCCSSGNYMIGAALVVSGLAIDAIGIPIWIIGANRKQNLSDSQLSSDEQPGSIQLAPNLIYSPFLKRHAFGITASVRF